jgi:hypothetical protein
LLRSSFKEQPFKAFATVHPATAADAMLSSKMTLDVIAIPTPLFDRATRAA